MALHDVIKLYTFYVSSKNSVDLMRQGWASPILLWAVSRALTEYTRSPHRSGYHVFDRVYSVPARAGLIPTAMVKAMHVCRYFEYGLSTEFVQG